MSLLRPRDVALATVLSLACVLAPGSPGRAAVWRVPVDSPTIRAAISTAAAGDTIRVVGGAAATYAERLVIERDLTIEGGWRADFLVRDPATLATVVRDTTGLFEKSVIHVVGPQSVTLDGLWVIAGRLGVEAKGGADLTIRNCTLRSQRNTNPGLPGGPQPGAGIHLTGGSLLLENTTFRNVLSVFAGAGVALLGAGAVVIRDCVFENATTIFPFGIISPAPGGAVYALDCGSLLLERVQMTDCASQLHWGGAAAVHGTPVIVESCTVFSSFSAKGGGALHFEDCPSAQVRNTVLDRCSGSLGGGVHAERVGSLLVENCQFTGNIAVPEGGGIWIDSSPFTIRDTVFDRNVGFADRTSIRGGGVCTVASSGTVENTSISNELATGAGGGWYQVGGEVQFRDCRFEGNESAVFGGALHIGLGGKISLQRCLLVGNLAKFGGACSASFTGVLEIDRCTLTGNAGRSSGAAVYVDTAARASVSNSILCCATVGDLVHCSAATVDVSYTDVWNDDTVNARAEFGGTCPEPAEEAGNINADPAFCVPQDPDYLLSPLSPCVGSAGDGGNMGWQGVGCPHPRSLREESWGRVKARYRSGGF